MNDTHILPASEVQLCRETHACDELCDSHEALRARLAEAVELMRAVVRALDNVTGAAVLTMTDEETAETLMAFVVELGRARVFVEEQTP